MSGSKIFGASLIAVGTAIQVVYVFWVALQLVSQQHPPQASCRATPEPVPLADDEYNLSGLETAIFGDDLEPNMLNSTLIHC